MGRRSKNAAAMDAQITPNEEEYALGTGERNYAPAKDA
jgi:hypothetical protein